MKEKKVLKESDVFYGAWLKFYGSYVQIMGIQKGQLYSRHTGWMDIDKFEPIPITTDFLLKNGYHVYKEVANGYLFRKGMGEFDILHARWGNKIDYRLQKIGGMSLKYIHELQRAFLLTKRKKFSERWQTMKIYG